MTILAFLPKGTTSILVLAFLTVLISTTTFALDDASPYLTSNSVVLITGAAGFVGSELAMALHRTYAPKKIICVDSMDNMKWNETTEEHLSLFDLKRQRAFHVWQTLGSTARFYRADFRPSIPEYFDMGEVPILDYIFREGEITHVVHLADAYHRGDGAIQAVPRLKHDIKSGMMEALMEQLRKVKEETGRLPHFTYASSYEVYNYFRPTQNDPNPSPFREKLPITTPSSLGGTSKLIDEIITKTYFDKYGINSIGLRFFSIYGPWGLPHTPLYEMAERAVTAEEAVAPLLPHGDDVRDYVYIDDAVDAIMAAMQFQSDNPHVINVGSGEGVTLTEIAQMIESLVPRPTPTAKTEHWIKTEAVADITRAQKLLGYQPQVSLSDGLVNLVSWHHDRAFPYGGRDNDNLTAGMASCSAFDKECLRGAPVYPCASECSHETQCTTSYYNDVTALTMALTEDCEGVLYTVDLSQELSEIPSAAYDNKKSHFKSNLCNIAFVSEMSPLVRQLKQKNNYPFFSTVAEEFRHVHSTTGKKEVLSHGFWTLVPLPIPTFTVGDEHTLQLLPKLSPGSFFGEATHFAIYCDPDVVFTNINKLLQEAKMQPFQEGAPGATALLVGHDDSRIESKFPRPTIQQSVQAAAYRMIRIGMIDEMLSHASFDSSWMVHSLLQNEDSRLFRCDVYGEIVQWDAHRDIQALEFVVGLHDMWARVLAKGKGIEPWWIGDQVVSVPVRQARRRLLEQNDVAADTNKAKVVDTKADITEDNNDNTEKAENDETVKTKFDDTSSATDKSKVAVKSTSGATESSTDSSNNIENEGKIFGGTSAAKTFEVELDSSASQKQDQQQVEDVKRTEEQGLEIVNELNLKNPELDSDEEADDDIVNTETANGKGEDQDMSTYDTWMGMLSSTQVHYFVRIVPSSQVGVIHLDRE
eukprot:CAMPEP_0194229716 /NCGR_PEP_ID=MMETSP0156-20130528/44033_1 /TAXON_ID=33649 /ORGANISM="Thalassionema nitzschioides, Strain L26-B" /LENGTH=925 /DNA_ID=CAMNT_0038962275 /DNA_START=49 /DNA_END=2826 /DNA_ORIENTATION=+